MLFSFSFFQNKTWEHCFIGRHLRKSVAFVFGHAAVSFLITHNHINHSDIKDTGWCWFHLQCQLNACVIILEVLIVVCVSGSSQCIGGRALWQDCGKRLLHRERCQQTHSADFRCGQVSAWYGHCAQRLEGNAYIFFPYNNTLPS